MSFEKFTLDLKNTSQLHDLNNKTFNEVWSFTATTTESNDDPVVCTSINLSDLKVKEYKTLVIGINDTSPTPTGFLVYTSSPLQFNPNNGNR